MENNGIVITGVRIGIVISVGGLVFLRRRFDARRERCHPPHAPRQDIACPEPFSELPRTTRNPSQPVRWHCLRQNTTQYRSGNPFLPLASISSLVHGSCCCCCSCGSSSSCVPSGVTSVLLFLLLSLWLSLFSKLSLLLAVSPKDDDVHPFLAKTECPA